MKDFFSKFAEEILNRKLHFLCSEISQTLKSTKAKQWYNPLIII